MKEPLQPKNTLLICKYNGKEVGRINAAYKNASAYVEGLAIQYKELAVDYIKDETPPGVRDLFITN